MNSLKAAGILPLLIVVLSLTFSTNIYVGEQAVSPLNPYRWGGIGFVLLNFIIVSFFMDIFASFTELKNFTNPETKNVTMYSLWKKVYTNPINGLILVTVMTFGITSAQSLSEYYRTTVTLWYDADLWALEAPLFSFIKGSLIDVPKFWDYVYGIYWSVIILPFCYLYRKRQFYDLAVISNTAVLAYFLTRCIALQYPTAGPMFYRPELFDLEGTLSGFAKLGLMAYMQGDIQQNGFIPGTMGMPSLHVGISFLAAWFISRHVKWTRWPSALFLLLTWLSTVILGWHYVLDGVGGIIVVFICVQLTRMLLTVLRFKPKCPEINSENLVN